jgi:hypothetical protein
MRSVFSSKHLLPLAGAVAVLVVTLCLCSCWVDQKRQLAQCKLDASRLYSSSNDFIHQKSATNLCMQAAGYELDFDAEGCGPITMYSIEEYNVYCYRPMSLFGKLLFATERLVIGHP